MSEIFTSFYSETDIPVFKHSVDSELELMMQDDGVTPVATSVARTDTDLGDSVFAIFEEILTEREQWILNAWIFERQGVRSIGLQLSLSKSQVHRVKNQALKKLELALGSSPAVRVWLGLPAHPCIEVENDEAEASDRVPTVSA